LKVEVPEEKAGKENSGDRPQGKTAETYGSDQISHPENQEQGQDRLNAEKLDKLCESRKFFHVYLSRIKSSACRR
jgi:hypothetical protein